ncbi:protein FAM118A isoform X3 [Tupaia chinensis]|uniref:protein FAM118A isoform X3 n=1 Tax=Tupaia chinensis TaxID=246437 RepID=UPI000FFC54F5|nr:protein FAM118A isoform X3 [Tupaia chinensis]
MALGQARSTTCAVNEAFFTYCQAWSWLPGPLLCSCVAFGLQQQQSWEAAADCGLRDWKHSLSGPRRQRFLTALGRSSRTEDQTMEQQARTGDTKPNFFQDCLMEVFDNLEQHIQNPLVLQSILSLMERGTMVLTTNYDNLLELFGQQQNKPMESLDLKDKTKVLQWARGHIRYGVLHIHGLYTDPCGMVLDPSGYKDVTQDPEVMEVLQNLYRTKSFLFMGCGETLRDQIFQALFLYSVPNKVALEHYMVVLKENEDHFFKHQADMLLHGIKVVSYGDCFDHFPGYVQDLAMQICKQHSPDADRVDSTTLLGNACQDCAKRKLEENGIEVSKKLRQSDTDDAGGS